MKSPCRNFFSCWFIAAVLVFLTILHQSEAGRGVDLARDNRVLGGRLNSFVDDLSIIGGVDRQLKSYNALNAARDAYVANPNPGNLYRRLEAAEEDDDASLSNLLHINLQELSLLNCQYGCKAAFALITSSQCNSTDALDAALEFTLEKELTFDMTHMKKDEDAPDYGWVTKPFRELANKSTDNTTDPSSPPISMAEFVTAAAMVTEFIDAMTPNQDFNLAVYLYNNETDPLACATLDLVTEAEELQVYYNLFGGGEGGEDGSDVVEGGAGEPVAAVGNDSSPLSGGLLAYAVAGISAVLSAILFA